MQKHVILSFSITIILLILLAYISVSKMITLSDLSDKLYKHPFAVTNSTKIIQANLISMHRYMKDVAFSKNEIDLEKAVLEVTKAENIVYKEFKKVFNRYLGDKDDIQKSYNAFVMWKPIRDEVISLVRQKKYDEAFYITKNKGAKHLDMLTNQVEKLIIYAQNKADYFHDNTFKSKHEAITLTISLVCIVLLIITSMFWFLITNLNKNEKEIKKYLHIIDQNIISVNLDENLNIKYSSNAFLKTLKMTEKDLLDNKGLLYKDNSFWKNNNILSWIKSKDNWEEELKVKDKNGNDIWFLSKIIPMYDSHYNIIEYNNILTNISSEKKIEEISLKDPLTGLYNRRSFEKEFSHMLNIINRTNLILVFVMIDIDRFKDYNDTYGHQKGDKTLKKVASVLKSSIRRNTDYAFRLGGEEFALLFTINDKDKAVKICENVKSEVENLKIMHEKNDVSKYITVSLGVNIISKSNFLDIDEIYEKTDSLLYKAKEEGRNRIKYFINV